MAQSGVTVRIITQQGTLRLIAQSFPRIHKAAARAALKRAGTSALAKGVTEATKTWNVTASRLKKAAFIENPKGDNLEWRMTMAEKRINLYKGYKAKEHFTGRGKNRRGSGISVKVRKRKLNIKRGFIATSNKATIAFTTTKKKYVVKRNPRTRAVSKYVGRFVSRGPNKGKRIERRRLIPLIAPGGREIWGTDGVQEAFYKQAASEFGKVYNNQIENRLNKVIVKRQPK